MVDAMADASRNRVSTSASSNSIGTGNKTFVLATVVPVKGGDFIIAADTAAPTTNYMIGQATADAVGTSITISVASGYAFGSGTKTAWNIIATGSPGTNGTDGTNGITWRSGSGAPSDSLGEDGDFYLRTDTFDVYKKAAGTYAIELNIKGATGATGSMGVLTVVTRSSNTILGAGDSGRIIHASGTYTQTIDAAATLGSGWWCIVKNTGTGLITLDPNGSETIDGVTTKILQPGETQYLSCNGTGFINAEDDYGYFSGVITSVADQDYQVFFDVPFGGTILSVRTKSSAGTATFTTKINTTALGGTANSVSTSSSTQAHSSANNFVTGDGIKITASSASGCQNAEYSILYRRR
jgi:hypothetical protein